MRSEMENLDERLGVQETGSAYELSEEMARDEHMQAILHKESNRWVGNKIIFGEDGCIDVVWEISQDKVEKAIKYATKSGRVMTKLQFELN